MKIKLNNVRLTFPDLFEPTQVSGQGAFKYRANFLIAKSRTDLLEEIKTAIKAVIKEKWGAKEVEKIYNSIWHSNNRFYLRDGDSKEYDGYAGNLYTSFAPTNKQVIFKLNSI